MAPPTRPPATAPIAAPSHPPARPPMRAPPPAPTPAPIAVSLPGVAHAVMETIDATRMNSRIPDLRVDFQSAASGIVPAEESSRRAQIGGTRFARGSRLPVPVSCSGTRQEWRQPTQRSGPWFRATAARGSALDVLLADRPPRGHVEPAVVNGAPACRRPLVLDEEHEPTGLRHERRLEMRAGRRLLSVREVATRPGVCTSTIYKLCAEGKLQHTRVSNAIRI